MRIDLHMHSTASDGSLTPTALVALVKSRRVDMMALTDHDTTAGVAEAQEAARRAGIRFVPGVEISTRWGGVVIHIVGLGIDPAHAGLSAFLEGICRQRESRGALMAERFEAIGIHGSFEGAMRLAQNKATLSRTHFARWLHNTGHVRQYQEAFDKYLKEGRPCCVTMAWPRIEEAVRLIHEAGGLAVLAHPGRYPFRNDWMLDQLLVDFKDAGGDAIEVSSGSQSEEHNRYCAAAARRMGFLASGGSDFHAETGVRPLPGDEAPLPADIPSVVEKLAAGDERHSEMLPSVDGAENLLRTTL